MRRTLIASLAAGATLVLSASLVQAADDNWLGTWKLNVEKSKYSPGPAPKSETITFERTDGGIQLTADEVAADGKATHGGYVAQFDGKEVKFQGNPEVDVAAPKRVDASSYTNTWKKGGKVVRTIKVTVAPGGKVLTVTQKGTDSKGQAVDILAVFDRQ